MKAIPSIAFNEFRGTASEVTARQVGGRTILNGRTQHSHKKTPKQSTRRASFSFITKQYKTLTLDEQQHWARLALEHKDLAGIGGGLPLTGQNLFVCLNANRSLLGVPLTKTAPPDLHGSTAIAFKDMFINPGRLLITGLRPPENLNSQLVVKVAVTEKRSYGKAWNRTVFMGNFTSTDWGDLEMTEMYTREFGIPIILGHHYYLEMYWIDENSGYVSERSLFAWDAVKNNSTHGRWFYPRNYIRRENIQVSETYDVKKVDIEIDGTTSLMAVDCMMSSSEAQINGYSFPIKDFSSYIKGKRCFVMSRNDESTSSIPYSIGCSEVYIPNAPDNNFLKFVHHGGCIETKNIKFFGTSPVESFYRP